MDVVKRKVYKFVYLQLEKESYNQWQKLWD